MAKTLHSVRTQLRALETKACVRHEEEGLPEGASELPEGTTRRDMMMLLGASVSLAGFAGCRRPVEESVHAARATISQEETVHMKDPNLESALRTLLDKQAIHEVMMRYCRAIDRADIALLRTVYWPDGHDDHGPYKGSAQGFMDQQEAGARREGGGGAQHLVCNELIEPVGDKAFSEMSFIMTSPLEIDGKAHVWFIGGRYIDEWHRRNGEWRIFDRIVVQDWETASPRTLRFGPTNPLVQGTRWPKDTLYRRRREVLGY